MKTQRSITLKLPFLSCFLLIIILFFGIESHGQAPVFTTCPANITVNTNPSACNKTVVYFAAASGIPTPTLTYTFSGATSSIGSGSGTGLAFNLGTTYVRIKAHNTLGDAYCYDTITVIDNIFPTINCPLQIIAGTNSGCNASGISLGTPTTSDNCSITSINNNAPPIFPIDNTIVTWSVTDGSGNVSTCIQSVIVVDIVEPTIICPPTKIANTNNGCTATGVNLGTPVTSDNCSVVLVENNAPSAFPLGNTYVTWTVYDDAGNNSICTQLVTVVDTIKPTIACPTSKTVGTNTACGATILDLGTAVTSDNCHVASVTNNAPSIFPIGTTTVLWTVTDDAGNTGNCIQLITVIDTVKPTISCPSSVSAPTNSGCTATGVVLGTPITSDNCTVASVTNNHASSTYSFGNTTVVWTVTDSSGNAASCSQLVTVIDTIKPLIICPGNVIAKTNAGCTATGVVLGTPTTSDNCTVASVTNNHASSTYPLGNTTVIWTATDGSGNISTCSQLVTVIDTIKPTITCPATVTAPTNSGCTATGVVLGTPTTSDNCSVASITNNHASSTYPLGNTTVVWTVTDGSGNISTCSQLVTVVDTVKPIIACPSTVTIPTNSSCSATGVALGTPTTSDNCTVASVTNNHPSSTYSLGNTTVIWTVADGSGNTASCSQLVTVIDTIKPIITCPPTVTVVTNSSCTATGLALGTPTTSDNCTVASVTNNHPSSTYSLGNTSVIWTVTDGSGNVASCSQLVTVIDTLKPTITCPPNVTATTSTGCTATGVVLGTPTTSDNCTVASVTNNHPSSTYPLGNTTVIWAVADGSGNISTSSQLVTIIDTVKPIITCPAAVTVPTNSGCNAIGVILGTPTTSDNCSIVSVTNNHSSSTYPLGNTTVVWTVSDGSGNVATCSQIVTVIDTVKPTILCPIPISATTNTACTSTGVVLGAPTTSDNCSVASITNNHPSSTYPLGNTTVIWTVTDGSGNIATCSQLISVIDTIKPSISCPPNVNITANLSCSATGVLLGTPTTSDNCTVASITNNHASSTYPLGNTTVIWTVTDGSGNIATCSQLVSVIDTIKPSITCPATISAVTNTGCTATGVILGTPITSDNCTVTSVTNNHPSNTYSIGNTTVIWTVTDGSGNTTSCSQLVIVTDTVKPTISCPPTATVETNAGCTAIGVTLGTPTTSDNCHVSSVTNNAPLVFHLGNTLVTWTVTDDAGNFAVCNQLIIVVDNITPIIICPSTVITKTNSGCSATGVSLGTPFTSDNCSIASITNNAPSTFPLGNTTVIWTVTDGSGNTALCSQLVTVNDTIKPSITCPPAKIITINNGCTATGVSLGTPVTTDNCSVGSVTNNAPLAFPIGNTTVTWTVTDGSGIISTCNQLITVLDTINPTINCPATKTVSTNIGCTAVGVLLGTPIVSDNCHVATVTNNAPGVFPLGNTFVIWTVTDDAGNTANCSQLVIVVDSVKPIIICPAAIIRGANTGCTATGVDLGTPITADNCSIASITNNAPSAFPLGNTSVIWTITDGAGNVASCNQLVTINDTIKPIITCPPAKIITINNGCTATGVSLGTPVTTDNCSVASVTNNAPLAFPIGITTVTWTVTDGSGNISTCNQLITVLDTINPTINCPATKTVSTNIGCTAVGVLLGTPIVSDNCHVATVTNNAPGVFPLGNTFVIWTVTDDAGNTANCSQLVIVIDSVKPTIICPAAINRGANTGCTATGVDLGTPITADNCSIASITNNAPSTFPLGNTSVIWTITDGAGNVASCNQLVTIKDTISPSIICPSTKIIGTNSGCNATGINLGFPIVSDNCHLLSVTNNAPAIFPIGNTLVNWIATDSSGNTSTCSQLIIVIDTVKPSISCPPDIIAITNAGCTAIGVSLGTPTASDNCDIENITNDAPGAFPIGTTVVTWTVFDESDNSSSCSQLVTVLDTIKPNIYCPSTIVTSTNFGCSAIGVSLGTPFVLDNCTIFSITNNAPPTFPLGNTIVTWTATDGSGNASSCTQLVTVNDNTNPTIVCPFNIVASTNNGCAATNIPLGAPTSNDNCSVASVTNNAPLSFPLGNTTVTWIVTDGAGNISTCNQTITIVDSIKPSINCPPDVFTTTNVGCIATGITLGTPITGDNCHVASVTNNAPGVFPLGNTIVVWTVTDDAGNSSSCSQLVNVVDNINPIIICPAAIISGTNSGCTASGISLGIPFTSDNCSITSITNNAPSVFPIGNTIVTWTVTDNSGNIATCTQSVTINDNINPTITCPPTIITATNNACNATGISLGTPITSDNCIISSVTNNAPIAFPLGNTNVIWTVTDGSGNITTCSQLVTVIDTIKPTISCPPTLTKTANNGCVATDVILGTPIVWDNCNVASVTNNAPNAYPIGNTIVTWMVVDNAGNATSCEQLVVVVDNTNPIIICPNTLLTATNSECTAIGVNLGTPFTSDNCSIASISNNAPSIFPLGNTIVTWTVTDSSGNFSTCNQLVTVYDNISPSISCPENIETYTDSSCYATHISLGFPFVSDNCTIASVSNNSPQAFIIGNTIVVWTVIDNSGNLSTCNQTVTVVDSIPPIIICHADIIDSTSPGGCSKASISLGSPITSDNCHVASLTNDAPMHYFVGTTVVTWTATDESGNSSNCSQLVYINSTPLAMDDSATTSENTPVQIMELANDLDCGNNLVPESVILVAGSGPLHGSAIVNPITGIITYIPNNSFFGQDQFDYQVCDSSNLCSIATVYITTTIINKQSLGIAKALTKVEVQDDASYNVSFLITAENLGNNIIDNIQITDNLNETFPLPLTFKIISAPYSNSSLSTNASYEGSSDIKLLDSVASHLNIGETATIEFSLNIVTSGIENTYYNSAFGSGYLSAENRITDISQNGFVTDPNGNGFAGDENENIATPVPLFFAIKIPNGFSPDGDGINDLFVIRGIENYPECKFTVYNRWGNVVYSKNGYKNDWDGKSSSSELKIGESIVPRGTYYYVFDYNKENRKPKCGYLIIQY